MSDELTTSYDIRGTKESGFTVECAWNIGKAVTDWLPLSGGVAVTCDASQTDIAKAVIEGLRLQGRAVIDCGHGDSAGVKTQIQGVKLAGGVMVGFDDLDHVTTIELYQHERSLIGGQSGLRNSLLLSK